MIDITREQMAEAAKIVQQIISASYVYDRDMCSDLNSSLLTTLGGAHTDKFMQYLAWGLLIEGFSSYSSYSSSVETITPTIKL